MTIMGGCPTTDTVHAAIQTVDLMMIDLDLDTAGRSGRRSSCRSSALPGLSRIM
jgi:hypothetical protein